MKTNEVACFIFIISLLLCLICCSKEQSVVEESISSDENVSSEEPISSEEISSGYIEQINGQVSSEEETVEQNYNKETISSNEDTTQQIPEVEVPVGVPVDSSFNYIPMSENLKSHVKYVSEFYEIEERIVYNIIYVESRFRKDARNSTCYGLMQVNKNYSNRYLSWGDEIDSLIPTVDIMNPYTNIVIGIRILKSWKNESIRLGYEQTKSYLEMYNKGYKINGSTSYADKVLNMDLSKIDFSLYTIVE